MTTSADAAGLPASVLASAPAALSVPLPEPASAAAADDAFGSGLAGLLQIDPWPPAPGALFWLALALVAGGWLGELARRGLGIPRIVGYGAVAFEPNPDMAGRGDDVAQAAGRSEREPELARTGSELQSALAQL